MNSKPVVTIIGLGYVGLNLFTALRKTDKCQLFGLDINQQLITKLKKHHLGKNATVTSDPSECLPISEVIVICVPTPITAQQTPNFVPLRKATETIVQYLRQGQLIILESTVAPGTCDQVLIPLLESTGLRVGRDTSFAHCPERINLNDPIWDVTNIPRVIGGVDQKSTQRAQQFYSLFMTAPVNQMSSLIEAESVKMVENIFRDVNIALVNEFAITFDALGVNTNAVITGAATKPFGFLAHYPGCGVGGDCIATDPYYFLYAAQQLGVTPKLIAQAREINESMPTYLFQRLKVALKEKKLAKTNSRILLVGLSYKPDVADLRRSPAVTLQKLLSEHFSHLDVFDPYFPEHSTVGSLSDGLEQASVLVVATAHKNIVKSLSAKVLQQASIQVVIDGRNCLDKQSIEKVGIHYRGIGQ